MRLRDMQIILAANINHIGLERGAAIPHNPNLWTIVGFENLRRATYEVRKVPALSALAAPVWSHKFVHQVLAQDTITAPSTDFGQLLQHVKDLRSAAELLLAALNAALPPMNHDAIVVELPNPNDLNDLASICKTIDTIIHSVSLDDKPTRIVAFDSGSYVVELVVAAVLITPAALYALSKASFEMVQLTLRTVTEVHKMQALGMAPQLIQNAIEHGKQLYKAQLDALASDINKDVGSKPSKESLDQIAHAIELNQQLIERGYRLFPVDPAKPERAELLHGYEEAAKAVQLTKNAMSQLTNASLNGALPPHGNTKDEDKE